jgi:hypothetical protein
VTFLASSESGAIQADARLQGRVVVSQALLWLSPLQLTLAALAVVVALYLGAVALASFAAHRGEFAVARWYRRAALWSGGAAGTLAVAFGAALMVVAPFHAAALLAWWPAVLLTVALFGVSLWALAIAPRREAVGKRYATRLYGLAAWTALTQVALALASFMLTRAPYLLYPTVRLADAVTPPATFTALSITVVVGLLFVIPSLGLLYVLFLRTPAAATARTQPVRVVVPASALTSPVGPAPAAPVMPVAVNGGRRGAHATRRAIGDARHTQRGIRRANNATPTAEGRAIAAGAPRERESAPVG